MEGEDLSCADLGITPDMDIFLGNEYSLTKSYIEKWNTLRQWLIKNPEPPKDWDPIHKSDKDRMLEQIWYDWKFEVIDMEREIHFERSKILRKHHAPKVECWNWLTLAPKPMLRFEDAERLGQYCEKLMDPRTIQSCQWVVECGKSEDTPNIHCHILYRHKNRGLSTNFKRDACNLFKRMFKDRESIIKWSTPKGSGWVNKVFRSTNNPDYKQMVQDKRDYMNNFEKSATHENFMDLNINGGF